MRDNQQFHDPEGAAEDLGICSASWSHAGLLWGASETLAKIMLRFDIRGKRILEVGCGLALSSLLLNSRDADITATDHHPDAEANLAWNVGLNGGATIPFQISDWRNPQDSLGRFDLIIGSDILYQPDHPPVLADFIKQHAATKAQVIIVDPSRGNFDRFEKELIRCGFSRQDFPVGDQILTDSDFRGQVRSFGN